MQKRNDSTRTKVFTVCLSGEYIAVSRIYLKYNTLH